MKEVKISIKWIENPCTLDKEARARMESARKYVDSLVDRKIRRIVEERKTKKKMKEKGI